MRKVIAIALACAAALAPAAVQASFRVKLQGAPEHPLIEGRGGLHAVDSRTERTLVRVISPGSDINKMGTVRVLVMNLAAEPFVFSARNVTLELADGTPLPWVPYEEFDEGAKLIERESARQAAMGRRSANNFSELAAGGAARTPGVSTPAPGGNAGADAAEKLEDDAEVGRQPGAKMREMVESIMDRSRLEPQQAAGGYLLFELPKPLRSARADVPIVLVVKTGKEEHRFTGLLDWQ